MVEGASRPQRLWPGLVLLLSPAALVGGFSTSAEAQCVPVNPITSTAPSDTVTNNGCITTGGVAFGISSAGADATITNSGTITASGNLADGIMSQGANATITNSGTITMSGDNGYGIYALNSNAAITNSGTITTSGDTGYGIISGGANSTITNSGSIATSSMDGWGIVSTRRNATITSFGTITTSGLGGFGINFAGDDSTITNSGTITTSGIYGWGIVFTGRDATITNSGTITTSGNDAYGIRSLGANATITNSGTITAAADGISVQGSGATISNSGTITAGAGAFGIHVNGAGSVTSLTNAQGGNTPLTYSGRLPATYNIFVRSLTSFGRLAVSNPTGTMTFGVDASSALTAKHYRNVLTGVPASAITNEDTQFFSPGGFALRLQAGSTEGSWDLLAWVEETATELGTARRTLLGLQSSSGAVHSLLSQRAAATTFALDYDCSVFDQHGFCVSVGFRNSQMGSNYADSGETAGLLTAAYRVTQHIRIGGFIDQNLVSQSPVGVDPKNTQPMLGGFAVYQENLDFSGLMIRAALAYQEGDLRITRPELPDTGRARTSALAFGGEIAYGVPLDGTWVAQPYLGLRHSDSQRRGYTETDADSATYPITYNRFGQQVTSATAGLRLRGSITPEFSLTFGAGMEYDLNSTVDRYAGRSDQREPAAERGTGGGLGWHALHDRVEPSPGLRCVGSADALRQRPLRHHHAPLQHRLLSNVQAGAG